jgi:hypothetical protein
VSLEGLLVLAVGGLVFWAQRPTLLGYIDGQYLLTLIRNQADFAPWFPFFSPDPLEALGDLWFFVNTRWLPELAIPVPAPIAGYETVPTIKVCCVPQHLFPAGIFSWPVRAWCIGRGMDQADISPIIEHLSGHV